MLFTNASPATPPQPSGSAFIDALRAVQPKPPDEVDVWPDCWDSVLLFLSIQTQWRMGPGGPIGLDYSVLYAKLDRMHVDDETWAEFETDIQVMESEALTWIHKKDG